VNSLHQVLQVIHVLSFVMMSVPLFNLIVVNERALMGGPFNFATDRYMENIIRHGAIRCYVFQSTVLASGILLVVLGPLGIEDLWTNWVLAFKTVSVLALMAMLSVVHFRIQPKLEAALSQIDPGSPIPDGFAAKLKPFRILRKRMATFCLFLVLATIILGMQVHVRFHPGLTAGLIAAAGLFALRVNRSLILFGWI
jgi:hypothetical protein